MRCLVGLATIIGSQQAIGCLLVPFAALLPGIGSIMALRGATAVAEGSLYRSGYELLYTPIPREKKRATKALIDVGADETGGIAGASLALLVVGIFPLASDPVLLIFGMTAGLVALLVTRQLHRGYVDSLAERLGAGSLDLAELGLMDATTATTVEHFDRSHVGEALEQASTGENRAVIGRKQVREYLASRSAAQTHDPARRTPAPPSGGRTASEGRTTAERDAPELDDLAVLGDRRSRDAARVRRALQRSHPLPDVLVAHVVPLLGDESLAELASAALRKVAPAHTGLLVDALLRRRNPLALRRRVCEILAELPTQRSASGLVLLLADDAFELRYRAAAAVLRIVQRNPHVVLDRAEILAAALRESTRCNRRWQRRAWVARLHARSDLMETADARYVSQGLGYVLTLLLAILDREPLRHAIRALSGDAAQRGTGLEYLDNVLPAELKTALWPLLEDRALAVKATSSEPGVLAELTAGASKGGDLATLRERIFAARRKRAAE